MSFLLAPRIVAALLAVAVGLADPLSCARGKSGTASRANPLGGESSSSRKSKGPKLSHKRGRGRLSGRPGVRRTSLSKRGRRSKVVRRPGTLIPASRVLEIQNALIAKGFLAEPASGQYDQTTVEAMRAFQAAEKMDVTGYPTAHSLKRLGLSEGPPTSSTAHPSMDTPPSAPAGPPSA